MKLFTNKGLLWRNFFSVFALYTTFPKCAKDGYLISRKIWMVKNYEQSSFDEKSQDTSSVIVRIDAQFGKSRTLLPPTFHVKKFEI